MKPHPDGKSLAMRAFGIGVVLACFIASAAVVHAVPFNIFKASGSEEMTAEMADWASRLAKEHRDRGFVVWTPPAWGSVLEYRLIPYSPPTDAWPPPTDEAIGAPIHQVAVINEHVHILVAITNVGEEPLEVSVALAESVVRPAAVAQGEVVSDRSTIRAVGTIASRTDGMVIGPLFTEKDIAAIRTALLPQPGRAIDLELAQATRFIHNWQAIAQFPTIRLAAYGTELVWLTLNTYDLPAGLLETTLRVTSIPDGRIQEVPIALEILPIELPRRSDLWVYVWDSPPTDDSLAAAYTEDLRRHGVNVFFGSRPRPGFNGKEERHWIGSAMFWRGGAGAWVSPDRAREWADQDPQGFEEAVRTAVRKLVAETYAAGLAYGEWWLELWDEPTDGSADIWVRVAQIVKDEDPNILLVANPMANWSGASVTIEGTFEPLLPLVDVWVPFESHLSMDPDGVLALLRTSDAPIGYYATPGIFISKQERAAYGFYRKAFWTAFHYDLDGLGFWAYNSYYGNPWDDWDIGVMDWPDAAVVYPGPDGPIASRNWEAFQEGFDEYRLLSYLAGEAQEALKSPESDVRNKGQRMIDAIHGLVEAMILAVTVDEVDAVRDRLYQLAATWVSE